MHLQEPIKVIAVFDNGVRPVKFRWNGRVYPVKEITYTWRTRHGHTSIVHFSVTDGTTLFELSYNPSTMVWRIEQVEA